MFHNVEIDILKKSLQDWMIAATISSSEHTYPGSSEQSRSRSNSDSNGSNPVHFKNAKDAKNEKNSKDCEKSKPGNSGHETESPQNVECQTSDFKNSVPEKVKEENNESHRFHVSLSGKSNSSISEHSATLAIEEEIEDIIKPSERIKETSSEASASNKRPRESDHDGGELPPKK